MNEMEEAEEEMDESDLAECMDYWLIKKVEMCEIQPRDTHVEAS